MAFGNLYTVGFAAGICVICSSALAAMAMGLKDMQTDNARRDLQKNILEALDLPEKQGDVRPAIAGKAIDQLWAEKVKLLAVNQKTGAVMEDASADLDGNGAFEQADLDLAYTKAAAAAAKPAGGQSVTQWLFTPEQEVVVKPEIIGVYLREDTNTVAIPMAGKGLWGPVSGYVAFDSKITTVQGATFFAPKETPGLGEKIVRPEFENAWIGKTVVEGGNTVPIRVLKPSACDEATDKHCVDGISGATLTSQGVDAMVVKTLDIYEPYIQTVR